MGILIHCGYGYRGNLYKTTGHEQLPTKNLSTKQYFEPTSSKAKEFSPKKEIAGVGNFAFMKF